MLLTSPDLSVDFSLHQQFWWLLGFPTFHLNDLRCPNGGCLVVDAANVLLHIRHIRGGGLDANHAWTGDQVLQIPSVNILVFAQLQSCTASYLSTGLLWRSEFQCAFGFNRCVWSLLAALTSLWVSVKSAAYNYYQGQTKWILYSFTTYNIADLNTLRSGRVNLHLCLQQINSAAICSSTPYAQVIINMGLRIICSVIVQNLSLQAEITAVHHVAEITKHHVYECFRV